ncbi:TPA: hypothetical protein HA231_03015, partial [Candidatus Woesearchaeota archaeon]|nr:hypothetical protein [Candidatus Woesearchaeota archaeon]
MVGSRLEDILLADFGTLERTLNANGFGKPRKLPNGFVVYQVRHPDDDLHIPGAYFGARKKSGSTCVESVVFGCADSLEAAVQSISGLPGAYKHESQRGGRMTLGAMSLSLAALLAGM